MHVLEKSSLRQRTCLKILASFSTVVLLLIGPTCSKDTNIEHVLSTIKPQTRDNFYSRPHDDPPVDSTCPPYWVATVAHSLYPAPPSSSGCWTVAVPSSPHRWVRYNSVLHCRGEVAVAAVVWCDISRPQSWHRALCRRVRHPCIGEPATI